MTVYSGKPHEASAEIGDPLETLDLCALVSGAAKLRPDRIAFQDSESATPVTLTFAALDRQVNAMAASWRDLGLMPGERILIAANASAAAMIAMMGALKAGLDTVLAAPHLGVEDFAIYAGQSGVVALAGEPVCGEIDLAENLFRVAAISEKVRIVTALGNRSVDGAVHIDPLRNDSATQGATLAGANPGYESRHARILTRDIDGRIHIHRQRTIVAAALDFVTRVQIGTQIPLVSTILPASFAGLAIGPAAALIAGAPLVLHAPFEAKLFANILDALRPVHLIAPAMLTEEILAAGLVDPQVLASLVLFTRYKKMPAEVPGEPHGGSIETIVPVFDLYGIGEIAAIAQARLPGGGRIAPLASPHMLNLDGRDVLAARRKLHYRAAHGRLDTVVAIEGAAVSQDNEGDHGGSG